MWQFNLKKLISSRSINAINIKKYKEEIQRNLYLYENTEGKIIKYNLYHWYNFVMQYMYNLSNIC